MTSETTDFEPQSPDDSTAIILTPSGIIFLLLAGIGVAFGLLNQLPFILIPSVACLGIFIFFFWWLFYREYKIDFKLEFNAVQIRAKTFLPVQVIVKSNRDSFVIISVVTSSGLFPVATSTTRLIELNASKDTSSTFLFYAPRRGKERIHSVKIKFGGLFGIFYLEKSIYPRETIIITPEPQRIQIPVTLKQKILDNFISVISVSLKGKGTDFLSLRDFEYGDEIRHIHWKATAKYGNLIVKEFEQPMQIRFLIVVDATTFMAGPKIEFALSATIELAELISRTEHSVKILVHGLSEKAYIELNARQTSRLALNLKLYRVVPEGIDMNYDDILQIIKAKNLIDSTIIFFTDLEQKASNISISLLRFKPIAQRIFHFSLYSPGFGTLAYKNVQNEETFSLDETLYRREILEKSVKRAYVSVIEEHRNAVVGAGGTFHLVQSYNTNIILELYKAIKLDLAKTGRVRQLGGFSNA